MAGRRKQAAPIACGPVQLIRHAGRFLLVQGDQVVDVTRVMGMVNNPMGQVSLHLRVVDGARVRMRLPVFEDEPAVRPEEQASVEEQSESAAV